MKLFKLFSWLLCLSMLLCLVGCNDPAAPNDNEDASPNSPSQGTGDPKDPTLTELESYITRARAYYNNACVKITAEMTATKGETLLQEERELCFVQGENKTSFTGANSDNVLHIYVNGTLYAPSTKKCFQVPNIAFLRQNYIAPKFHVDLFDLFQYEEITITKNPDGTTTVSGISPAEEAQGEIEALFGPALDLEGAVFDYSSLCSELIFDAEGRLLQQCARVSASAYGSKIQVQRTQYYAYGVQYAVSAPADANAYTTVTSITDLFQE